MKRIGVKFCGGCNPTYERVEMLQRIRSRFEGQFLFLYSYGEETEMDATVHLCGCPRACPAQDSNPAVPHYSVTGEADFEPLVDGLNSFIIKGDPG
jgi:sulfite reductase beta subunit-like hemoprotein